MSRVSGSSRASKLMGRAGVLPTLSLDFTAMGGTLNSLITFTRASNATFINSSGYVVWAATNMFYNTAWTTTSLPTGWSENIATGTFTYHGDGSITCATTTAARAALIPSFPYLVTSQGLKYTFGFTVVSVSGSPQIGAVILSNQTVETLAINGVTVASSTVVNAGDTVSCTFTADGTGAVVRIGIGVGGNVTSQSIRMSQPRANPGLTLQTYLVNTATDVGNFNTPRFDYDSTLAAKGLLLEGPATNLLNWSETFATSGGTNNNWADTNLTRTSTNNTSPRNDATALRITASAANGTIISSAAIGTSASRVLSVWLRRVTGTGNIQYTLDNGATYTTQAITSSWVRYSFPATTAAQRVGFRIVTSLDAIEIWGAQLETEASTSYIATGSSQVARSVDTAIFAAGSNFSSWYTGGTTGTFVASWYGDASTPTARSVVATNDQTTKHLHMYQTASALTLRLADFNAAATVTTANSLTADALTKGAFSYASTATSLCLNGGTVATGTLAFSAAPTWLSIGGPSTNGTSITATTVMLNNSIRTLQYYPARLTDGQIQGLTA